MREAAQALGITVSKVHRPQADCFQNTYENLIAEGWTDRQARDKVAQNTDGALRVQNRKINTG